ncbi:glycosyltransferase family protein [Oenococcus oeni]
MKRKGLFSLGNRIIFYIFNFFIFLTLYFAIASPNLTLGDTPAGNRTTWISVVFLLFLLTISLAIFVNEKLRNVFRYIFIKRALFSSIVIFVLVILLQIIFVELTHPSIGFDAGAIHSALTDTKSRELQAYYSLSTNNINLMLQQHYLAKFFSNSSWLLFDNINLFLVDLSAVFNALIVAVLDRRKISNVLYIQSIWLALFPMILVPYSDTWVLPFV